MLLGTWARLRDGGDRGKEGFDVLIMSDMALAGPGHGHEIYTAWDIHI